MWAYKTFIVKDLRNILVSSQDVLLYLNASQISAHENSLMDSYGAVFPSFLVVVCLPA